MIPLFKSHFSVGKSILTLAEPEKQKEDGPDSIISIALENGLKEVFLVEDSFTGFLSAFKACKANKLSLKFGIRITVSNSYDPLDNSKHKVVLFALNDEGFKQVNRIYTFTNAVKDGFISSEDLSNLITKDVHLVIPFYDSYIWNNNYTFSHCIPDFIDKHDHTYFVENNKLPFDKHISDFVSCYAKKGNIVETKSIYYKNRSDYDAWVTYKIACNRRMGKFQTLSAPELNGCASREFCIQSWKESK